MYPTRAPIGIYDPGILCNECEREFSDWDAYAQKVLSEPPGGPHINSLMVRYSPG